MKRFVLVLALLASGASGGCNKPSPDECRAAIRNMEKLHGTESETRNLDIEGEIRRCRGGSRKEAVTCAGNAKTLEELNACAFMTPKRAAGTGSAAPAAPAPPAASAGSGTPGSAAPAAPAGSDSK